MASYVDVVTGISAWTIVSQCRTGQDRQLVITRFYSLRWHVVETNPTHRQSTTITSTSKRQQGLTHLTTVCDNTATTIYTICLLERLTSSFCSIFFLLYPTVSALLIEYPQTKRRDALYEPRFTSLAVNNPPMFDWCLLPSIRRWNKHRCHKTHHQCSSDAGWLPSFKT